MLAMHGGSALRMAVVLISSSCGLIQVRVVVVPQAILDLLLPRWSAVGDAQLLQLGRTRAGGLWGAPALLSLLSCTLLSLLSCACLSAGLRLAHFGHPPALCSCRAAARHGAAAAQHAAGMLTAARGWHSGRAAGDAAFLHRGRTVSAGSMCARVCRPVVCAALPVWWRPSLNTCIVVATPPLRWSPSHTQPPCAEQQPVVLPTSLPQLSRIWPLCLAAAC